jgi:ribose 5-phosphate isomerase B
MNDKRNIAIGSDHAGFAYKQKLAEHLRGEGYEVHDVGCFSEESCHYPVFAHKLCELVQNNICECGILICGTGIGMSMAANKHRGIRAAALSDEYSAELTRQHNDANVLCLGARVVEYEKAEKLADIFLNTAFMGGKHSLRIAMFGDFENNCFKS